MMMKFLPTAARVRRTISIGKALALLDAAAPGIGARVRARGDELVDQIALAAHDLDAVVAGVLRELRAADEIADRPFDAAATTARAA